MIVTGGGTGGHTYPALTAFRTLNAALTGARLLSADALWVGKADGLESRVAADEGIEFRAVATGKIRRAGNPLRMLSPANVSDMGRVPLGVVQARGIVADFEPDVVLATGGYVAVPVGVAARMCRCPLVVHEQTVRLGLTNRTLARVATRMAVSSESSLPLLPDSVRAAAVVTGNPVRPEILTGKPDRAVADLGLDGFDPRLPTVYVTGGAQGSQQMNALVTAILPWLLGRANVIHQCGADNLDDVRARVTQMQLPADQAGRRLLIPYVAAELPDVLALADVVVSRSGAGTIAELAALGKAAILVPLAGSAGNEQVHNARHLAEIGAAIALVGDVGPDHLRAAIAPLLTDVPRRTDVAKRAQAHGRPEAAARLVEVILAAAAI
ncbi:UDP-N-acetylglucosamine--N-acetylmuramyl-(pentapeptide) pyrophosphoryl-undecaprenol N-acetylglucosamine transferase [Actinomadura darangshiensis]|nr:UDP-N-acetylglucosamine--N-acetylmuramyl-(pentapeptide) pyrophosphoryl-undecaprenol N-acetylglucosamine transferase [Actinomadura darangshiensis]